MSGWKWTKLPDSNLSVTSCESSSLSADTCIWYISPALSSFKSVSLTSPDLHLKAKWFLFPLFLHSFPNVGHNFLFSRCWYPQLSHSLPCRLGPCCGLLRGGFLDFRELLMCSGSTLLVSGTTLFVSDLVASPMIFVCACILSGARQISSVFARVSLDSRSNLLLSSHVYRKLIDLLAFHRGLSCRIHNLQQAFEVPSCIGHSFLPHFVFSD